MTSETPRRSGGRNARRQTRSAPLAEHLRPVRAGLEGGQYRPLTQEGMERIHRAALDALEQIGLSEAPQSGIDYMTAAGAILGDDGRIRFPRALVEDALASANRGSTTPCFRFPRRSTRPTCPAGRWAATPWPSRRTSPAEHARCRPQAPR